MKITDRFIGLVSENRACPARQKTTSYNKECPDCCLLAARSDPARTRGSAQIITYCLAGAAEGEPFPPVGPWFGKMSVR